MRHITSSQGPVAQVGRAIGWLGKNFLTFDVRLPPRDGQPPQMVVTGPEPAWSGEKVRSKLTLKPYSRSSMNGLAA